MKVFYTQKMVADFESFSPSASKPKLVVESWLAHGFNIDIVEPDPVSLKQLYRAHNPDYVDGVLSCRIPNGFGNRSKAVANSLIYTSGALLDAAHEAISTGGFSCAPVSGFHHACWGNGGGYCTFNGLMVTALDLLDSGAAKQVGILDCDNHYGNGTDDIIKSLGDDGRIVHFTTGKSNFQPISFLKTFADRIRNLYSDCDVLLYQAGADPHIDDPLGGWMTTEQLHERDIIVFETAREMNLPVAWNLAGGYQRDENGQILPVLLIHDNTMRACLSGYHDSHC
jgi:acetoin utilization deacetylase AcuC-like enzyme